VDIVIFFLSFLKAQQIVTMADKADPEAKIRSWGFPHVFTWTDGPYVLTDHSLVEIGLTDLPQERPLHPTLSSRLDDPFDPQRPIDYYIPEGERCGEDNIQRWR
jgi:hypothetical protein